MPPKLGPGFRGPSVFVPPGGFAGFGQQTPATQAVLGPRTATRAKTRRTKRRKKANVARRKSTAKRKRRSPVRGKKSRLVKGSAAAKRHMARLRKMRKK